MLYLSKESEECYDCQKKISPKKKEYNMCNTIIQWTMHNSASLQNIGLTFIRMSLGVMFTIFGYNKLLSGSANLTQLGSAISLLGITHGYILWGYLAALTELCGGLALVIGLCTRIASLPLIFLLIVAIKFHLQRNDSFTVWAFPALCLCLIIGFLITGSGIYSADYMLTRSSHHDL
jgi:putative oxidoreductase